MPGMGQMSQLFNQFPSFAGRPGGAPQPLQMEQLADSVDPTIALTNEAQKGKNHKKHPKKSAHKHKKTHKKHKKAQKQQPEAQPEAAPTAETLVQKPIITTTTEVLDGEKKPAPKKAEVPKLHMSSVLTKDFVNGKVKNFTMTVKFTGDKEFAGEPEALEKALHHLVQWENDHHKANKTGPTPIKQLFSSLATDENADDNQDDADEEDLEQEDDN